MKHLFFKTTERICCDTAYYALEYACTKQTEKLIKLLKKFNKGKALLGTMQKSEIVCALCEDNHCFNDTKN